MGTQTVVARHFGIRSFIPRRIPRPGRETRLDVQAAPLGGLGSPSLGALRPAGADRLAHALPFAFAQRRATTAAHRPAGIKFVSFHVRARLPRSSPCPSIVRKPFRHAVVKVSEVIKVGLGNLNVFADIERFLAE